MRSLLLALLAVALVACSSNDEGQASGDTVGFEVGDGSVTVIAEDKRQPAPILTGPQLGSDGELSTADYEGQMIVLNVWGSWCAPCRAEAPALNLAAEELDDVQFLGINTRDLDPAPAEAFLRTFEVTYPSMFDPDGALLLDFGQLPPAAIPSTLIIDEQGRVAARVLGEVSARTLIDLVDDVRGQS